MAVIEPSDFIQKLVQHWATQGVATNVGATPAMVRSYEAAQQVTFPDDFREYLLRLNGFVAFGSGVDPNGFGFLPLQQIRAVAETEYPSKFSGRGYFVFAEYLGWSWAYATQLADDRTRGEVIHILTSEPKIIAPSFRIFIDLYLMDSPHLYPGHTGTE